MPPSQESEALINNIQDIELSFKGQLDDVATYFFKKGIINRKTYNEVRSCKSILVPEDKAHMLLEKLTDAVEEDKTVYHIFMTYLRSEAGVYKVILKKLEAACPTSSDSNQEDDDKGMHNKGKSCQHSCEIKAELAAVALLSDGHEKKKYKMKVDTIHSDKQHHLDDEIEDEGHIYQIADHMTRWDEKPHLLMLKKRDVDDIQEEYAGKPKAQRSNALFLWKNRAPHPTYRCLLCICVIGECMDGTDEIVNILNTF